jgi:hypothetical protein
MIFETAHHLNPSSLLYFLSLVHPGDADQGILTEAEGSVQLTSLY